MSEARTAVVAAIDLARGLGDWPSVGAAAATLNPASIWPNQPYPAVDHELIALLEDALRTMPEVDSPTACSHSVRSAPSSCTASTPRAATERASTRSQWPAASAIPCWSQRPSTPARFR